ncbi:MAG: ATP-dependent helicase [Defluviitaleaceae bacterium]|nr:ATP-dependent helicase [Defluviitaleaceae bacterium]
MLSLNANQEKAAAHINGPMMVLAGPGSGKTAVITARAANLVNAGINPANILVITYSKAAAQEMERRFAQLYLGSDLPKVNFGTFHSMFFRVLRRNRNCGLDAILADGERRNFVRGALKERQYDADEDLLLAVTNEMSLLRNELHHLAEYQASSISPEDFREICQGYETYKGQQNKIDFDDMLCHSYEILKSQPAELEFWQRQFKYIMIDEFQDINRVQYEAVKLLAEGSHNIFVVGDDDQSIYRFRGSRPEFLLNFPQDFAQVQQVTLDINYRSTLEIIDMANSLIVGNKMRYDKGIRGTGVTGKKPVILVSDDQNHEAIKIAEAIRSVWKKGAKLSEIAITYRLNMQARAFMDVFLNMNIPFKNRDEIPTLYEHWVAQDIFAYLRVIGRLGRRQKIGHCPDAERIINKPFRYISQAFLQSMRKNDLDLFAAYTRDPTIHTATKTKIEELKSDLTILARRNTHDAIKQIRRGLGYNGHIMDHSEYRRINHKGLFEIADELQEAAKQFPNPADFISHAAHVTQAAKETPPTGDCCTLTTLHSAKGLEFERVFIAGVVEEILPSIRSKTEPELEEERRLLYVGITRAKKELYLSTIKSRYDKPTKPSRFIKELT